MTLQFDEEYQTNVAAPTGSSQLLFQPGDLLDDKYRILSSLGQGGMGTVYRAEQIHLSRQVAIKVLRSRLDHEDEAREFVRRFRAEAAILARIQHPNAVSVYDFGFVGGNPYLVMELLPGKSLREVIRERRLRIEAVLRIGEDVCRAIHHAHLQGVVHRDLKPDNIIVTKSDDGSDRAIVLDFGIAKIRDAELDIGTPMTKQGVIVGTPQYTSPEQIRGGEIDGRSDLYALGIILYELVAGGLPFVSDSAITLAMKHLTETPAKLSERETLMPVPEELEQIIFRCLEKDPAVRHASAEALADDLARLRREILGQEATAVSPVPRKRPASLRATRILMLVALAVVLLIAIPRVDLGWTRQPPIPRPPKPPIAPVVKLSDQEVALLVETGKRLASEQRYLEAIDQYRRAFEARPEAGEIARLLADASVTMGDFPEARTVLKASLEKASADTKTLVQLGYVESVLGDRQSSLKAYQRAVELGVKDAIVFNNLGVEFQAVGKYSEAIIAFEKALRADVHYLRATYNLAESYEKIQNWEKAVLAYRLAVNLDPKNPTAYQKLANALTQAGRAVEAQEEMLKAMRLYPGFKSFEDLARNGS